MHLCNPIGNSCNCISCNVLTFSHIGLYEFLDLCLSEEAMCRILFD